MKPVLLMGPDGERPFSDTAIERELRAMWKGAVPERGAIYRAALANVIAPLDPDPHAPLDPVLVELTRRHPSQLEQVVVRGRPALRLQLARRAAPDGPRQAAVERAEMSARYPPRGGIGMLARHRFEDTERPWKSRSSA